jgi:hypothetical protein
MFEYLQIATTLFVGVDRLSNAREGTCQEGEKIASRKWFAHFWMG